MEFPKYPISQIFDQEITRWTYADVMALHPQRRECVARVIEAMGEASAESQGIPQPVTSMLKLKHSDQRVYLFVRDSAVLGLIKIGAKTLFIMRLGGEHSEINPLCLLDFYIHKGKQRQGLGKEFFDAVLQFEQTEAHSLAYDKPSKKVKPLAAQQSLCSFHSAISLWLFSSGTTASPTTYRKLPTSWFTSSTSNAFFLLIFQPRGGASNRFPRC